MSEEDDFLRYCINFFGEDKQEVVCIEEMAELTQQLSKFVINHPNQNRDKVVEEYVDVLMMLSQIKIIFCIKDEEIERNRTFKLARLKRFIEGKKDPSGKCPKCNGKGYFKIGSDEIRCPDCNRPDSYLLTRTPF